MGELNSRIEGLKAQLSLVHAEVLIKIWIFFRKAELLWMFQAEMSRTKLSEAADTSMRQRACMDELQIRIQDDKKVLASSLSVGISQ